MGWCSWGAATATSHALDAASGDLKWKFQTRRCRPRFSRARRWCRVLRELGQLLFTRSTRRPARRNGSFHGGEDRAGAVNSGVTQSSPAVVNGVPYTRDAGIRICVRDRCGDGQGEMRASALSGSWVISSPAVSRGKGDLRHARIQGPVTSCSTSKPAYSYGPPARQRLCFLVAVGGRRF